MGLDREATTALLLARSAGADFSRSLMLGRQRMHIQPRDLAAAFATAGLNLPLQRARQLATQQDGFVEPLLELMGAARPESMDNSDFEGSTLVHDLNEPVPDDLKQRYSLVWDGGTLEHVFNFPTAIANAMTMTAVGGHYLGMAPANNWMGHGFFQFSPELWFRVLSPENGFEVRWMLIKASRHPASRWYRIRDPHEVGERVTLTARTRGTIYVLARRTEDRPLLASTPQQSDYADAWSTGTVDRDRGVDRLRTRMRSALNDRLSSRVTDALFTGSTWVLPAHDKRHFQRVEPEQMARSGPGFTQLSDALGD